MALSISVTDKSDSVPHPEPKNLSVDSCLSKMFLKVPFPRKMLNWGNRTAEVWLSIVINRWGVLASLNFSKIVLSARFCGVCAGEIAH